VFGGIIGPIYPTILFRWAKVKSEYKTEVTRLAVAGDYNVEQCKALVRDICRGLDKNLVNSVIYANAAYINLYRLRFEE
jgi:hypothetical protein